MKNKGFTLIEVLAVVIVLGVLASVSFPIIKNTISANRKKAFEESLNGVVRSIELYVTNNGITNDETFSYNDESINKEHDKFISGEVIYHEGIITINDFSDGEYCGTGTKGNYVITDGNC